MSVEMMRSEDLYREPKHRRLLEQDQTPARSAPSSASPGPWLTNTIVDALLPDDKSDEFSRPTVSREQYRNARLIIESFHKVVAGPPVLEPVDEWPNFSIVNQADVLSGPELLDWRRTYRAEELEEYAVYQAKRKARKAKTAKKRAAKCKPELVKVSDEQLDAQYALWYADPSPSNQAAFLELLHHFLSGKTKLTHKDDTLRKRGEQNDFQQSFLIDIMSKLAAQHSDGKQLDQPSHYITRSWTNGRIDRFEQIAREYKRNPRLLQREEQALGEQAKDIDLADKASHESWMIAEREVVNEPEHRENVRLTRLSKIDSLDPADRDLVGMRLQSMKQKDIAKLLGVSQPTVSNRLAKTSKLLQAMPDALVGQ